MDSSGTAVRSSKSSARASACSISHGRRYMHVWVSQSCAPALVEVYKGRSLEVTHSSMHSPEGGHPLAPRVAAGRASVAT